MVSVGYLQDRRIRWMGYTGRQRLIWLHGLSVTERGYGGIGLVTVFHCYDINSAILIVNVA